MEKLWILPIIAIIVIAVNIRNKAKTKRQANELAAAEAATLAPIIIKHMDDLHSFYKENKNWMNSCCVHLFPMKLSDEYSTLIVALQIHSDDTILFELRDQKGALNCGDFVLRKDNEYPLAGTISTYGDSFMTTILKAVYKSNWSLLQDHLYPLISKHYPAMRIHERK